MTGLTSDAKDVFSRKQQCHGDLLCQNEATVSPNVYSHFAVKFWQ
jgi:hypothetical protein